ncbi:MAG: hypothetical protein BWK73_30530 [Thiothrix lacustris]|uniref:DUF3037 domain-containing protein n=1 Tax=Thiothrix lacustris TaxID=525917 RepID=A0A1Y1QJ27_9GAMM|nr:MAG: hypothetical protein BWK73_30530 [Thiothrix lacustris]
MKQACKYNIIRFQPYPETQEFANIGIVLYAPKSRTFAFRLLAANRHGRVTQFFDTLDKTIFQNAVILVRDELKRIQRMMATLAKPEALYDDLVRPREDIVAYSGHYVRFTENPETTADELFEHYVNHSFAQKQGHEERMRASIAQLLISHQLAARFKDRKLGNELYEVRLPFVTAKHNPTIIKPIHFRHTQSKQLVDHGLQWKATMQQLFRMKAATPEQTLFTYEAPESETGVLRDAFEDVRIQIEELGIQMLNIAEQERIAAFARG